MNLTQRLCLNFITLISNRTEYLKALDALDVPQPTPANHIPELHQCSPDSSHVSDAPPSSSTALPGHQCRPDGPAVVPGASGAGDAAQFWRLRLSSGPGQRGNSLEQRDGRGDPQPLRVKRVFVVSWVKCRLWEGLALRVSAVSEDIWPELSPVRVQCCLGEAPPRRRGERDLRDGCLRTKVPSILR